MSRLKQPTAADVLRAEANHTSVMPDARRQEIEALRAALVPFAAHAEQLRKQHPTANASLEIADVGRHRLTLGDFDRALALISGDR